jgi:hypothetical protein
MNMWIGVREVVLKESFLIRDNEEARIETTVGGQPLKLSKRTTQKDEHGRIA